MLAVLLCVPALAGAYEIKDNPDRFPSVGLNYSGASLKGDTEFSGFAFGGTKPQMKESINNFMGDLRLPATENLTFEVGAGYAMNNLESNDGTWFLSGGSFMVTTPTKTDLSGPSYKVGARYYFK